MTATAIPFIGLRHRIHEKFPAGSIEDSTQRTLKTILIALVKQAEWLAVI
jgi:hypothetical protein